MPRRTHVLYDSLLASLVGFAASTVIVALGLSPRSRQLASGSESWCAPKWAISSTAFGWAAFLFPIALIYHSALRSACNAGLLTVAALLGIAIPLIELWWLSRSLDQLIWLGALYVAAGALNACFATIVLLARRRRAARQYLSGA